MPQKSSFSGRFIDETAFGPDHPKVAIRINNLGLVVLRDLGDLDGAREAFQRAVVIFEKVLGLLTIQMRKRSAAISRRWWHRLRDPFLRTGKKGA